jgi:Ca2+-transporting ATPase
MATSPAPAPVEEQPTWHVLSGEGVTQELHVAPQQGLTSAEAEKRLAHYGPNRFAEAATEPRWRAFVRQYDDPMQIVLLAAGIISIYPVKQPGTGVVILLLTVLNAVLGLNQEGKAAAAVAALAKMMIVKARVRRDGALMQIPAEQLVPGDVVAVEAGDVVSADGRLLATATLEVAEAALTGESLPSNASPPATRLTTRSSRGLARGQPRSRGVAPFRSAARTRPSAIRHARESRRGQWRWRSA